MDWRSNRLKDETMDETAAIARLKACGVIPVVVIEDASRAIDLAHALVAGGIDVVEVTLRRPALPRLRPSRSRFRRRCLSPARS